MRSTVLMAVAAAAFVTAAPQLASAAPATGGVAIKAATEALSGVEDVGYYSYYSYYPRRHYYYNYYFEHRLSFS